MPASKNPSPAEQIENEDRVKVIGGKPPLQTRGNRPMMHRRENIPPSPGGDEKILFTRPNNHEK